MFAKFEVIFRQSVPERVSYQNAVFSSLFFGRPSQTMGLILLNMQRDKAMGTRARCNHFNDSNAFLFIFNYFQLWF